MTQPEADPGQAPVVPLGMFPLGTVLFPGMPLPLHVFEPRYRALTKDCLRSGRQFGVVLIERGSEVGGDDDRFGVGTVARIVLEAEFPDGRWALVTKGEQRIRIVTWLPDDPYPVALVQDLPDEGREWLDPGTLSECERTVRRALALAAELGVDRAELPVLSPAVFDLDADPLQAAWQLCAAVPVGSIDRQRLLEAPAAGRLDLLRELAQGAAELFAWRLSGR
ncbi:MAG TPA: LON peptidase substrate-binding domain-containing protein [Acidimicrobiales bacterium]|nr:LON peptidase substrate-binding domain-containing protein [Acidimicrobiales bacterium]